MKKIAVIGSLNLDIIANTPRIPAVGETVLARFGGKFQGGKGANQAAAIAKLGGDVVMLGCVGADSAGELLLTGLIDAGVDVINPQDLVNGIDWIADNLKGKVCVELDIDRQSVTVFGTPAQIDALIGESVKKLGSKQGGLMMIYGLYPGTPLENAAAVMDAMEKYAAYYS